VLGALGIAALGRGEGRIAAAQDEEARYVVGISPFLGRDAKNDVYRSLVRFVLEDMPLDSSLWLYDAYHLRTIAQIEVPRVRAFESGKTRANQFKERLLALKQFLATSNAPPEIGEVRFEQALRLPQFLDFVSHNLHATNQSLVVLMLGGPFYLDDKEPGFSMVDGYFPSDGHLLATRDQSVYGLKDRPGALRDVTVHYGYFGDPWASAIHQEKIVRFWTLYLEKLGGRLATFTGDLPTVFNALRAGSDAFGGSASPYHVNAEDTKIEMLRVTRDVGVADWITRDRPTNTAQGPPRTTTGSMKIGIRWQGNIDLDLYARPRRQSETLYFEHTRIPEGYYFKDHRSSPDREYEFVEFVSPVDVWESEAQINFYEGSLPAGPEGEVRIEFDGRIYSERFAIESHRGNRGREGRGQERFWVTLDIPRILKLR
jgi:hypothetical protein